RFARVKRRIGIGAYAKVIDQIVVDSEAGPHGPGSPAGWIPSQAHAWLQQVRSIVLRQARIGGALTILVKAVRIGLDDEARIIEIVGSAAMRFVPAVGQLISQDQT